MSAVTNATTHVVSIDDDRDCPLVGTVIGWEDDDRVLVAWGDERYADDPVGRVEYADTLAPRRQR